MKVPAFITVLILIAGAGAAWYQHSEFAGIRADHTALVARAAERGIALDPERPTKRVRIIDRRRDNRIVEARQTASDIIDFNAETKANLVPGSSEYQAAFERWTKITKRFATFDTSQVKMVIGTLLDSTEISEDRRKGVIYRLILHLKERDPQTALEMLCAAPELFPDDSPLKYTISDTFALLARQDMNRMIDWFKANEAKMPADVSEKCKTAAIGIAAQEDPRRAFDLIRELGVKNPDSAIRNIAEVAKEAGPRTVALGVIREYLATISNEWERRQMRHRGIATLANKAAEEGFEKGTRWIADAGLSAEELESLPQGFEVPDKSTESGKWIEWLAETVHGRTTDERIRYLVSKWTGQDHRAAGEWLAAAPDGPTKNISIQAYAATVSKYEPETATKWTLTLPPGKDRDRTLKNICQNWPNNDPAAKEAFAKEHGIK